MSEAIDSDSAARWHRIRAAFDASHPFHLAESIVVLAHVGSVSHNTYVPKDNPDSIDDVDFMGALIPPIDYRLGLETFEHWIYKQDELDVVIYSFDKLIRLLLKQNPNVLGLLWQRDVDYIIATKEWLTLKQRRELFASRDAFPSFSGYAYAQLKRMTRTDNPFQGYMGEKRKALVMQHGYDTKNAAHLIRLLRMCIEFLRTGSMQVFRTHDADELRAIKRGEWPLESIQHLADSLFELARIAVKESELPEHPDTKAASTLLRQLHLYHYGLGLLPTL